MSGGQALGHWEVKNCYAFKALAVCKQEVSGNGETLMPVPHIDLNAPCPTGWESRKGLSHCYMVVQRVNNQVLYPLMRATVLCWIFYLTYFTCWLILIQHVPAVHVQFVWLLFRCITARRSWCNAPGPRLSSSVGLWVLIWPVSITMKIRLLSKTFSPWCSKGWFTCFPITSGDLYSTVHK